MNKPFVPYKCLYCKDKNWLVQCTCGYCDFVRPLRDKNGRLRTIINGHNSNGMNHNMWKYGRSFNKKSGYWRIIASDYNDTRRHDRMFEHVYFYEKYHNLCMLPWGAVHHLDENKENNMPHWNLQGMMSRDHKSLHTKIDMSNRTCIVCKSNKTWKDKNGHYLWRHYENGFLCNICSCRLRRGKIVIPLTCLS